MAAKPVAVNTQLSDLHSITRLHKCVCRESGCLAKTISCALVYCSQSLYMKVKLFSNGVTINLYSVDIICIMNLSIATVQYLLVQRVVWTWECPACIFIMTDLHAQFLTTMLWICLDTICKNTVTLNIPILYLLMPESQYAYDQCDSYLPLQKLAVKLLASQ